MSNPSGEIACAECVGTNCAQSACNKKCEYGGSGTGQWCNTIYMGFMVGDDVKKDEPLFEGRAGLCLRKVSDRLALSGVEVGDLLTHINGSFVGNNVSAAADTLGTLSSGTLLAFMKLDGTRLEVKV
jgi:hypothetical protein